MCDREDPALRPQLVAENAYTEACQAHLAPLRQAIFEEIRGRTEEDERGPETPWRGFLYYHRNVAGGSYPVWCRRAAGSQEEEVLLDANLEAEEHEYFELGCLAVSPDGRWLAWSSDTEGDERYQLRFREIGSGRESRETLRDVAAGGCWAADSRDWEEPAR